MTAEEAFKISASICYRMAEDLDGVLPNMSGGSFTKKFCQNALRAAAALVLAEAKMEHERSQLPANST